RQRHLPALVLLVGVDVGELRQAAQRVADARLPGAQLLEVVGQQRVLELRAARAAADADLAHRHHEQPRPGYARGGGAQPGARLLGALLALAERLERDEHPTAVDTRPAGEAGDGRDGRV